VIHSLTENIGHVHVLFISFFEWRMFSRWIVTDITSARGTFHCRKTRIPCGDQLIICGLYWLHLSALMVEAVSVFNAATTQRVIAFFSKYATSFT
jgi:hypothetical protein